MEQIEFFPQLAVIEGVSKEPPFVAKVGFTGHKMGLSITTPDGQQVDPATGLPFPVQSERQE